jgi:hypothetical protein
MPRWPPSSGRRSALSALRVVLDTQVFLRGAVARTESLTARIYEAWLDGRFTLLASEPILAEVDGVLRRTEVLRKLDVTVLEARARAAPRRRAPPGGSGSARMDRRSPERRAARVAGRPALWYALKRLGVTP